MTMLITKIGLQSIENAKEGGFLLNLSRFAVSEFPDVNLSPDDTDLAGTPVYEGAIDVVECLDDATVRFTLTIPKGYPTSGKWSLTELGVYQDSGELFARGSIEPVYPKDSDITTSFTVNVVAQSVASVINLDVGAYASVPSTPTVKLLQDPLTLHQNVVAVLDQNYNSDGSFSPGLSVKYGPGGRHWGFIGYDRVYTGLIGKVVDAGQFVLNPAHNGFFVDKREQVLVQLTVGADGQTNTVRRMVYWGDGVFKDMGDKFPDLDNSCFISIWKREIPASLVSNTIPIPRVFGKTFNGKSSSITLPFEPAGRNYVWVFVNGLYQNDDSFKIQGREIVFFEPPPKGCEVAVEVIELVQGGEGTVLASYQFDFPVKNANTTRLRLQMQPQSTAYVRIFFDGIYQSKSEWRLEVTDIHFESPIPKICKTVTVQVLEEQQWKNHVLAMRNYSVDTNGFSLIPVMTYKGRDLDSPTVFLGSVFQSASQFNTVTNNLQFEGIVPDGVACQVVEMYREPPDRVLALKSETDIAVKDGYAVGPNKIRLVRNDGSYFDIDLSSSKGQAAGTVLMSKQSCTAKDTIQLLVGGAASYGLVNVICTDSSVAEQVNGQDLQTDKRGNISIPIKPLGISRTVTMRVLVNNQEVGTVSFNVVMSTGTGSLTINNSNSVLVTPGSTLIFEVLGGPSTTAVTIDDSEGNKIEVGYTDASGYLEYMTKYDPNELGAARKVTYIAYQSATKALIGSAQAEFVNNGPVFLVNGSSSARVVDGENLTFSIDKATANDNIVWRYATDAGMQEVQMGATDIFGAWSSIKSSSIFHRTDVDSLEVSCEVGNVYIGSVLLRLFNNTAFLVDGAQSGFIRRNTRLLFEIINGTANTDAYWVSSDEPDVHNKIGKTNEKGYASFTQTYQTDIGPDRSVMYTAYVGNTAAKPLKLTIVNPTPKVKVNGLDSAIIYPDSTMIFTIQDATPGSSIAMLSSSADVLEHVGVSDSYGDLTWNRKYTDPQVVDGSTFSITVTANGVPAGTVQLRMVRQNKAHLLVNSTKAAVIAYGKSLTFDITSAVAGSPITLTDSEGHTLSTGHVDSLGAWSYTRSYGFDIGLDRTITVYAQSENVILDQVQLIVLNNVGGSPRFRVDGATSVNVADASTVVFSVTGARPGSIITWSIPSWGINQEPLGNVDRNGNLAYAVQYSASQFLNNSASLIIEASVDGTFIGTVTVNFVS